MSKRSDGLLHLFNDWRDGAIILAGTAVAPPVYPHVRIARECPQYRCQTTVLGDTDTEAAERLADHRRRCHGQ